MAPLQTEDPISVVTAKALIVGDSGVGKSGLASRLDSNTFKPTASTHRASRSRLVVPSGLLGDHTSTELEIWDLAGQPDYNVMHQVFMEDSHVALIVSDESREDTLGSIPDWARMVEARCPNLHAKILVSARIDRGGPQLDDSRVQTYTSSLGFKVFVRTSAFTGQGIDDLRKAILESVDWLRLPRRVMPRRWRAVEQLVHSLASSGARMLAVNDIRHRVDRDSIASSEMLTVMTLMHQRGDVFLLQPRPDAHFVLLDPDILNQYGSSVVLAARSDAERPGTVSEAAVLRGNFDLLGFLTFPCLHERGSSHLET